MPEYTGEDSVRSCIIWLIILLFLITKHTNLAAHNSYEAELKNRLRECILSGAADSQLEEAKQFESFEELVEYIRERHAYYLESPRCIADDIRFILRVCYQVVQGIFQLCVRKQFHMGGQPAVTV